MAQRQFRSDDTSPFIDRFGTGVDGAYSPSTSTDAPIDSACTGTASSTSLSATNVSFAPGQLLLIHQTQKTGAGNWELNKVSSYTTGTITTSYPLINTYGTGAQVMVLKQYTSASIGAGVTVTGKAWDGTVGGLYGFVCLGQTTITGTLSLAGKGFRGANGRAGGNGADTAEGTPGAGAINSGDTAANGNGGGAGGGNGGGGGGGGNGTAGSDASADMEHQKGRGGSSAGTAALTTAVFGGGGGGGSNGTDPGNGANGGGLGLIISRFLTVTGSVVANGNNGTAAISGGGGGAGGSILLKGQILSLGSTKITAAAGSGGSGTWSGGGGGVGRIHADYASSLSGSTSPTLDSTQDPTLADTSGMFLFNMI